MSTFRKVSKARQKNHRERSQPASRAHLGLLEKKKDYKQRSDQHHKRENTIKALRQRALNRNPHEFYFNMVRSKTVNGIHKSKEGPPTYTPEQLKLIESQDLNYVNYKRSLEQKKIDKLKSSLHLVDVSGRQQNQHIVYVDTKKEVREFDAAKYLKTDPSLIGRTYNRLTIDQLSTQSLPDKISDATLAESAAEKSKLYAQLCKRIERERQLGIIAQKMETKKHLLDKKSKKKQVKNETVDTPGVYRWAPKRKR